MANESDPEGQESFQIAYLTLPLSLFKEGVEIDRDLYLLYQGNYILFQQSGHKWDQIDTQKLTDFNVTHLYIKVESRKEYVDYLDNRMSNIITSGEIPKEEKAQLVFSATVTATEGLLKNPDSIDFARQNFSFVKHCVNFLNQDRSAFYDLFNASAQNTVQHAHGLHVSAYAVTLAKQLGYESPEDLQAIGVGGMLIDIGMTKVPKEILEKPGKLTDAEFAEIKKHPQHGYEMTEKYAKIIPAISRSIVLQHHERGDAKGYPRRLSEERIHPFAKIVRIADMFDAMTSKRPWRDQKGALNSAKELLECAVTDEERKMIVKFVEMMK